MLISTESSDKTVQFEKSIHCVSPPDDVMAIFQVHFRILRVRYTRARTFLAKFWNAPSILNMRAEFGFTSGSKMKFHCILHREMGYTS